MAGSGFLPENITQEKIMREKKVMKNVRIKLLGIHPASAWHGDYADLVGKSGVVETLTEYCYNKHDRHSIYYSLSGWRPEGSPFYEGKRIGCIYPAFVLILNEGEK